MQIVIQDLALSTKIGVPDGERENEQTILATLMLEIASDAGKTDNIADTVDYERVYNVVRDLAKEERHTVEKFAEDIAQKVLEEKRVERITVTLRKDVLPETKGVEVSLSKSREDL